MHKVLSKTDLPASSPKKNTTFWVLNLFSSDQNAFNGSKLGAEQLPRSLKRPVAQLVANFARLLFVPEEVQYSAFLGSKFEQFLNENQNNDVD